MAQTIQIRRGSGSAVPSSLAAGELAINTDTGKFYYGNGSAVSSDFRVDSITAESYTISSSVTSYTFQSFSGSTDFGDDVADIHKRTGSLNVSGSVIVDGALTATDVVITDDLTLTDDVNINATGKIYLNGAGGAQFITSPTTGILELEASSKVYVDTNLHVTSDITASGNIQIGNDAEINSVGSMVFRVDSDADEGSQTFTFRHNASTDIAELDESGVLTLYGNQLGQPAIELQQNTQTATFGPPVFIFNRTALASDNGDIGRFDFKANDDATNSTTYAQIIGQTEETGNGTEGGKITFKVASHDAELQTGLLIEDGDAEDEIDVTIGNTTTSLTTVAGNLSIGNSITSNITASGTISASGEIEANTFKAAGNVDFNGDLDVDGTTNLDAVDIDGNVQLDGTLTVGVSGTGHDVTLFGDTHGKYIKWDQSADLLDIRSETNFGTGGAGVDVTFFGDTNGKFMLWDQSMDHLKLYDNTNLVFGTGLASADFDASIFWDTADLVIDSETDIKIVADGGSVIVTGEITSSGNISSSGTITANAFVGDITGDLTGNADTATALTAGNKTIDGNLTIGAAGGSAGHDLKLYGDTNNQTLVWDASEDFLKFTDGTKIVFGTGQAAADFDSSIQANGSNLVIYNDTGDIHMGDTVIVTGSLEVTTNITSSANISSSGTVTADRFIGSQLTMVPWNYYVSSNHSDELYIPQGGSQIEINSDQPYNFMLAPYDGKVKRLSVYYQTGDPGTLTARVRAAAAPFDLDDADDIVQELTQTSVVDDTAYFFDFDASFSKGEAVAITLEAASHAAPSYVVGCIAVEYDTTT